jgi:hypothetical protein
VQRSVPSDPRRTGSACRTVQAQLGVRRTCTVYMFSSARTSAFKRSSAHGCADVLYNSTFSPTNSTCLFSLVLDVQARVVRW